MKISVLTPSIRAEGLKVVELTLLSSTFTDFEWLYRLSVPGGKPDLCHVYNDMMREAKGELIVSLQDYTRIQPDGLQRFWDKYQKYPDSAFTAPLGKTIDWGEVAWDWRKSCKEDDIIKFYQWEADYASCPAKFIREVGGWDEDYDSGWSYDNVDLAARMEKVGLKFRVDPINHAVAWDHDKFISHPFRSKKSNADLWVGKQREIESGIVKLPYLSS
jgi:hypothetical protein